MNGSRCTKPKARLIRRGMAPALMMVLVLTLSMVIAAVTPMQAGKMDPFASSRKSGNACSCHYNEYIAIDNYSMPSQLLMGQSGPLFVNVSVSSTLYDPAKSQDFLVTVTVTVSSTKGYTTIQGSPKQSLGALPGFSKEYAFNLTGKAAGSDTIKISAKIASEQHYGSTTTDTVQPPILIIKPKEAPILSNGRVTPTKGYNQTIFSFAVIYLDTDADLPVSISVIIDGKAPRPLTVTDGNANNILNGEDYSTKVNGSVLGLGNHTFRFTAADSLFNAVGDNITHQGPRVDIYVAPNKPPVPVITSPKSGSTVQGWINVTGTATDPDKGDVVTQVDINFDNGSWVMANGTSSWYSLWDLSNMTSGNHAFFVRATDGENYSKSVALYIHVDMIVRNPPSVVITSYQYIAENILEVKGTSTRGNNSGPVDLVHVWVDNIGTWTPAQRKGPPLTNGTPSYDSWSWTWNTSEIDPGIITISARAWTEQMVSPIANIEVTVVKFNHPPVIISTDPVVQTTRYEGSLVQFTVIAGDPDRDMLTYAWAVDKIAKQPLSDPTMLFYKTSYTSAGVHDVTVTVSDGHTENGTAAYTWKLTILKGFVVTDKTILLPGPLNASQAQPFEVGVLDPEGGKITYAWTVDDQKDPTGVGPTYTFLYEPTGPQTTHHSITLVVKNSQSQSKELKWSMDVKGVVTTDPGKHHGKTKYGNGLAAQIVPWFFVLLVMIAVIYTIFVMTKKRKEPGDDAKVPPLPAQTGPPPPPQAPATDPNTWQGYPPTDQQTYQYPPTENGAAPPSSTDPPPQGPDQGV
jgi:hypothetical protein